MIKTEKLTLSYMQKHPKDASKVLERLPIENVSSFLEQIPVRISANVITMMSPYTAAKIMLTIGDEKRSSILRDIGARNSANIMRHMEKSTRNTFLQSLPTKFAWRIKSLLKYPQGTIGSVMNPEIIVANSDLTVQSVLDIIRKSSNHHSNEVYLVDERQKFLGVISFAQLIRTGKLSPVENLADRKVAVLSAKASINSAIKSQGWASHSSLPVLDRSNHIVGDIQHNILLQPTPSEIDTNTSMGYLLGDMLDAYWTGWLSALDIMFSNSKKV